MRFSTYQMKYEVKYHQYLMISQINYLKKVSPEMFQLLIQKIQELNMSSVLEIIME
jgi:hypothetical protein